MEGGAKCHASKLAWIKKKTVSKGPWGRSRGPPGGTPRAPWGEPRKHRIISEGPPGGLWSSPGTSLEAPLGGAETPKAPKSSHPRQKPTKQEQGTSRGGEEGGRSGSFTLAGAVPSSPNLENVPSSNSDEKSTKNRRGIDDGDGRRGSPPNSTNPTCTAPPLGQSFSCCAPCARPRGLAEEADRSGAGNPTSPLRRQVV